MCIAVNHTISMDSNILKTISKIKYHCYNYDAIEINLRGIEFKIDIDKYPWTRIFDWSDRVFPCHSLFQSVSLFDC